MCLSCGCGSPDDRHGDQRNITWHDIDAAAQAAGTTHDKVVQNIMDGIQRQQPPPGRTGNSGMEGGSSSVQPRSSYSQQSEDYDYGQSRTDFGADKERDGRDHSIQRESRSYAETQGGHPGLHDGYRQTEGEGYGESGAHNAQDQPEAPAQQGYDPRHSGVRHAQDQPGKRVDEPGRETGSAWGEQLQMGHTTDTPDRRNPAN